MNWHILETTSAILDLGSSAESGLTAAQVKERRTQFGPNELIERGGRTPLQILWAQVTATTGLILMGAAVAPGLLGDTKNTIAILAIVALYAFLGFIQEYRAEQAITALKKM